MKASEQASEVQKTNSHVQGEERHWEQEVTALAPETLIAPLCTALAITGAVTGAWGFKKLPEVCSDSTADFPGFWVGISPNCSERERERELCSLCTELNSWTLRVFSSRTKVTRMRRALSTRLKLPPMLAGASCIGGLGSCNPPRRLSNVVVNYLTDFYRYSDTWPVSTGQLNTLAKVGEIS